MAILILDEFERAAVGAQRCNGVAASRQHHRVVEDRRRSLETDVDLDGVAGCRRDRSECRGDEPRHGAFACQAIAQGDQRRGIAPVGNQDRDPSCPDAAVARSREQR